MSSGVERNCRSTCVIWPTFSASVIRASRSATRLSTGAAACLYTGVEACEAESAVAAAASATTTAARMARRRALPIREPEAEREQRVVVGVADVDRHLLDAPGPGVRELRGRRDVAEEHVRDARALAAREPGGDERVPALELLGHDERAAGDEHGDSRHARGADTGERGEVLLVEAHAVRLLAVAEHLRVRRLADDDDRDVVALGAGAVLRERHLRAGGDLADPVQDRHARRR